MTRKLFAESSLSVKTLFISRIWNISSSLQTTRTYSLYDSILTFYSNTIRHKNVRCSQA
jgi:hypothetical protein